MSSSKRKFERLIKRFRYVAYVIIFILGVVLIATAKNSFPNTLYSNIALGIGCSIVASVLVTVILLVLIPDGSDDKSGIEEWGVEKVYCERGKVKITFKNFPKKTLYFIAFGLRHFRDENKDVKKIANKIKGGLEIKILTLNPNSLYLVEQEKKENKNQDIKKDIEDLISWVEKIKSILKTENMIIGSIELKLYNSIPLDFYCQKDNDVYVSSYMPNCSSGENVMYRFNSQSNGGRYYSRIFEKIWNGESSIDLVCSRDDYFLFKQTEAIETVLKYFCNLLRGNNKKNVIGVIAIIKGELRKTFFSCNKSLERQFKHPVYAKNMGSVGKLIEMNRSNTRQVAFFSDYANRLAYTHTYQDRNESVKKVKNDVKRLRTDEDETLAILAVPLFVKEQLIGVLTFDFAELPSKYEKIIKVLQEQKDEETIIPNEETVLMELFNNARSCRDIVVKLLGHNGITEYEKLYEEEWKRDDG